MHHWTSQSLAFIQATTHSLDANPGQDDSDVDEEFAARLEEVSASKSSTQTKKKRPKIVQCSVPKGGFKLSYTRQVAGKQGAGAGAKGAGAGRGCALRQGHGVSACKVSEEAPTVIITKDFSPGSSGSNFFKGRASRSASMCASGSRPPTDPATPRRSFAAANLPPAARLQQAGRLGRRLFPRRPVRRRTGARAAARPHPSSAARRASGGRLGYASASAAAGRKWLLAGLLAALEARRVSSVAMSLARRKSSFVQAKRRPSQIMKLSAQILFQESMRMARARLHAAKAFLGPKAGPSGSGTADVARSAWPFASLPPLVWLPLCCDLGPQSSRLMVPLTSARDPNKPQKLTFYELVKTIRRHSREMKEQTQGRKSITASKALIGEEENEEAKKAAANKESSSRLREDFKMAVVNARLAQEQETAAKRDVDRLKAAIKAQERCEDERHRQQAEEDASVLALLREETEAARKELAEVERQNRRLEDAIRRSQQRRVQRGVPPRAPSAAASEVAFPALPSLSLSTSSLPAGSSRRRPRRRFRPHRLREEAAGAASSSEADEGACPRESSASSRSGVEADSEDLGSEASESAADDTPRIGAADEESGSGCEASQAQLPKMPAAQAGPQAPRFLLLPPGSGGNRGGKTQQLPSLSAR
eukprot:TRINITY_DN6259_c1_g4_i2.p1 TRINITY_DN6259_c1_g4~~TRINITY_DN6259_c1_g4_i2.p1  ORF type:complete len:651 (-),score=149.85 TRINITY_DN6259_c1_g4_i2:57-2009(-)